MLALIFHIYIFERAVVLGGQSGASGGLVTKGGGAQQS